MESILVNRSEREALNLIKSDTASIKSTLTNVMVPILKRIDDTRKRYGFRIKKSEADPALRVEYIYDAVGKEPAKLTANKTFNYGGWADVWFIKENYPCMVKSDGREDYKLNPNDYSKKAKDGTVSDYNNLEYDGNAMSAIPLCWVQRYEEDGYEYFVVCQTQYDDSYKAYAHTRADGTIANYFYHAMFKGSLSGTETANYKLRSLGGQMCQYNTNAQAELTYAKRTGSKFSLRSWSQQCLIADLCTLISKTDDSQTAFGTGHTTGYVNNANQNYGHLSCSGDPTSDTHSLITAGQFSGFKQSPSSGTEHVKVFHIEDFWGERWDRVLGLIQRFGVLYVKMTPEGGTQQIATGVTEEGYNFTGAGYETVSVSPIPVQSGDKNRGWLRYTNMSDFGRLPDGQLQSGSETTYTCDYHWINNTSTNYHVALCGGSCGLGSMCGFRCLDLDSSASATGWGLGGSLTLIP